jgi:hypothetical protein
MTSFSLGGLSLFGNHGMPLATTNLPIMTINVVS